MAGAQNAMGLLLLLAPEAGCVCVWGGCLCVGEAGEVGRGSLPVYMYSSWKASDSCNGFSSAQQATAPGGQGKFLLYPIC